MSDYINNLNELLKEQLDGILPSQDSQAVSEDQTVAEKPAAGQVQTDSIQKAEQKDAEMGIQTQAPNQPMIPEPSAFDPGGILLTADEKMSVNQVLSQVNNNVISNILDKWEQNIEENKKINKEELERKIRLGLDRVNQYITEGSTRVENQIDGVSQTSLTIANLTAFTIMTASTVGQIANVQNPVALNNLHNLTPGVFNVAPAELQRVIAWTGALLSSALVAPALMTIASKAGQIKGKISEDALATQVAFQTLSLVRSNVIKDVVNQKGIFASLTPEQRQQLITKFHLTFLLNALALYYEKETGWNTEEEMAGLISKGAVYQKIKSENPNDPRLSLVAEIRKELMGLPSQERESFLKDSLRFLSKNPSYAQERELSGLLSKMWDKLDYERLTENAA